MYRMQTVMGTHDVLSNIQYSALVQAPVSIQVKDMTVRYVGKTALHHVSTTIEGGCITGIIGPNGAGKSTLLKGLMRLVPTASGEISLNGTPIEQMRKHIAYVEQRSQLDLSFPINVQDTVLLGTYPKLGLFHRPGKCEREKAMHALETVQMQDYAKRQIGTLSGGQLQRVFIARALAQETDVCLLDEPFVGIDVVSEELIMQILFRLRDAGKTVVIVHHDLHKVKEYFDNVILLNGTIVAAGSVQDAFTEENLAVAYGQSFLSDVLRKGEAV